MVKLIKNLVCIQNLHFGKVVLTFMLVGMMIFGNVEPVKASELLYYYDVYTIKLEDSERRTTKSVFARYAHEPNNSHYNREYKVYRSYYWSEEEKRFYGTNLGSKVDMWRRADDLAGYYDVSSSKNSFLY